MSARRVPTATTELRFKYMGDPKKVLIENKDIRFLELWKQMGLNKNSPQAAKDDFWEKININIALEKTKSLSHPEYRDNLEFYTDDWNLADAQRRRNEVNDTLLGYGTIYRPGINGLKTTQSPPPRQVPPPPPLSSRQAQDNYQPSKWGQYRYNQHPQQQQNQYSNLQQQHHPNQQQLLQMLPPGYEPMRHEFTNGQPPNMRLMSDFEQQRGWHQPAQVSYIRI